MQRLHRSCFGYVIVLWLMVVTGPAVHAAYPINNFDTHSFKLTTGTLFLKPSPVTGALLAFDSSGNLVATNVVVFAISATNAINATNLFGPTFAPIVWIDASGHHTNTWAWDPNFSGFGFDGNLGVDGGIYTYGGLLWFLTSNSRLGDLTGGGFFFTDTNSPIRTIRFIGGAIDVWGATNELLTANTLVFSGAQKQQVSSAPSANLFASLTDDNGWPWTNLFVGNIIAPTNALPNTTVVDFSQRNSTTNMAGNVTWSSLSNLNPTNYNWCIRHCVNTSGGTLTVTPSGSGWQLDIGAGNSYSVTNNTCRDFWIECQVGQFTNIFSVTAY